MLHYTNDSTCNDQSEYAIYDASSEKFRRGQPIALNLAGREDPHMAALA
jgi:hypothetical protein